MPFIEVKTNQKLTEEKKEQIKSKLGLSISILHKPESFLMIGFVDNESLFFAGKELEKGAFVSVSLFGSADPSSCSKMTASICKILEEEIQIPGNCVYVAYYPVANWGWNGNNF